MKKTVLLSAALASLGTLAQADEMGRVISSTPVIQQVGVPRQVCTNQPAVVQQPKSGAGAVMGALAGGAVGNAIGGGNGRAAATVLGIFGGALLGDRIEGAPSQVQSVQQCSTQTFYENRTVAYSVVYEYAGKQYSVQMPNDPGPYVRLQITPVGAVSAPPPEPVAPAQPTYVQPIQPVIVQPVLTAPPTVYYPAAYYHPYYPPVGVSLSFGYSRGYYHHPYHHWH